MPVLRARKGKNEGETFAVFSRKDATVLGRGEDAEVCLDDNRCSRKHAHILLTSGRWMIEDLGSSNGTLVNGEKIDSGPLPDQATIQIGNTLLAFEEGANLPPPRKKIYDSRLLETLREEAGVFVYHAHQAALDRALRVDLFAPGQDPTAEHLEEIQQAVKLAADLKHDLIDAIIPSASDFSDSDKIYVVHKSRGGTPLDATLEDVLAESLNTRIGLARQLLIITLARVEIPGLCLPINLSQLQVQTRPGSDHVLSAAALELPTLVGGRDGALCHLPAYTDYLPPELTESGKTGAVEGEKALAYSAAAISYHLLTGAPVMGKGENTEILQKHRELKPAPANLIQPDIPEELSDLLGKMLEKEPGERPSGAEALEPVISLLESSSEVVEIQGDYQEPDRSETPLEPSTPASRAETRPPPIQPSSERKPVISRSRLEEASTPRPSGLKNLVTLPFWAALWLALFYGSSKIAEALFSATG